MKRVVSALALAGAFVLAFSNTAMAATPSASRISRGDPFTQCLVGGNGTGRNFRSAEVEPWIADNPARTANLVGTWQQARYGNVQWRAAGVIGVAAAAAAQGGVVLAEALSGGLLRKLFAGLLVCVAIQIAWRARQRET